MTEGEKDRFCRHVLELVQRLRDVQLGIAPVVSDRSEPGALAGVQYQEPRRQRVVRRRVVPAPPAPVAPRRPVGPNPLIAAPPPASKPMQWARVPFDPDKARARAGEGV